MRLLPSEQQKRAKSAIAEFQENGELRIYEPCDCGSHIRHTNGGNYHEEIFLKEDNGKVFVKYETTSELVAPAEWESCEDWDKVIEGHADWL